MDERNQNSRKDFDKMKIEGFVEKFKCISLRDVPLETRREQARKPLFLARYE